MTAFYTFSNGIRLRRSDVTDEQIARYTQPGNPNLHEPVEEQWLLTMFERDRPAGAVFLDVGAGVGYYACLVMKRWPDAKVYAIEALARHADAIIANRDLNGLPTKSVMLMRAAVGTRPGRAYFADYGYGSMLIDDPRHHPAVIVDVQPFGRVLSAMPQVHLMKMDIQGAELEVLRSAAGPLAAGHVRHLIVGTHGSQIHQGVADLLSELKFEIVFDDPSPPMQPDGLLIASCAAGG